MTKFCHYDMYIWIDWWASLRMNECKNKKGLNPVRNGTYDHLHRDRDGAVECWVSTIFGHHCQVDHPVGNLLIVQRPGHADHWWMGRRGQRHRSYWTTRDVAWTLSMSCVRFKKPLRYLRSPPPWWCWRSWGRLRPKWCCMSGSCWVENPHL